MINSVNYQHQHCPITNTSYELNSLTNMNIGGTDLRMHIKIDKNVLKNNYM